MRLRRWLDISDIELIKKIIPTLTFKFPYSPEEYEKNLYLENYHCHKILVIHLHQTVLNLLIPMQKEFMNLVQNVYILANMVRKAISFKYIRSQRMNI